MTIRIPHQVQALDHKKLTAVLTRAMLNPPADDARGKNPQQRLGADWLHWSEANGVHRKLPHPLD
ncbi:MAG: hypothetical protein HY903_22235 [Deltaproteobacteria bacterium]|nr:hypothetical protein [Deltaproteobacteria bacterium]